MRTARRGEIKNGHGALYRLDPDLKVTQWRENLGIANTVAWNRQRTTFYFGDSVANAIYQYDYDSESGAIANERVFWEGFSRGAPDGSAMDAEGYLWNCRYGGGCAVRVGPDGSVDRVVEMPVLNVTTCTFGGRITDAVYHDSGGGSEAGGSVCRRAVCIGDGGGRADGE